MSNDDSLWFYSDLRQHILKRQPGRELVCSRKYKENHKTLQHLKIADKINESHE